MFGSHSQWRRKEKGCHGKVWKENEEKLRRFARFAELLPLVTTLEQLAVRAAKHSSAGMHFDFRLCEHFKVMPDLQNRSSLVPSKTSVGLTVLQEGDMNELLQQSLTAALEQVLPEVSS